MSTTISTTDAGAEEVRAAALAAASAFPAIRSTTAATRAGWLAAVADAIEAHAEELIDMAVEETRIPRARLAGEVVRTTSQLRLFGAVITEGSYLEAAIDHARPEATPPQPDLRRLLVPLGPVAVFSASNFPFAFSVAGGDTASALAAGNPVIVKGHGGHRRLSARTAQIVTEALAAAGAPEGVFGHLLGVEAGAALVGDPAIRAVSFTGSTRGGRALFDIANGRPDPIPFYGELGSLNPVIVTPGADARRADELAAGLAESFQVSLGQLCTKPGLVMIPRGGGFADALTRAVAAPASGRLLNDAIGEAFAAGSREVATTPGVRVLTGAPSGAEEAGALVVVADLATARATPALTEEHFGPLTVLVEYDALEEAFDFAESLGGSLTVTLHAEPGEVAPEQVDQLRELAGRILFAGWPTGVAVTWAQHHGGPWPSTTSLHTSVGATAIRRFLRPVVYQSAPAEILPAELRDDNPLGIPRRVDGSLRVAPTA